MAGTYPRGGRCSPSPGRTGTGPGPLRSPRRSGTARRPDGETSNGLKLRSSPSLACRATRGGSYYVGAERPEGVGPAHVQVSLVVSLQKPDVVVTLGLQGAEGKGCLLLQHV